MSLGRRTSLSGFEMTTNHIMKPARGDHFRRRMSLATLGTRKYGRSVDSYGEGGRGSADSYGEGGVEEGRQVEREVVVRHVPIVIEGSQGDCEMKTEKDRKIITSESRNQLSFSKFSQAWIIPDDLSSLGSLSSENSLDSISRLDRIEEVVKAWMMRNGDRESRGRSEDRGGRAGSSKISKEVVIPRPRDLTRKPFSDISQNRATPNERKAPIKRNVPEENYLSKTDTGYKNCPVHKPLTNVAKRESMTGNTLLALKTPSLLRNSTRTKKTNSVMNESKVENGRPMHVTNVPISKTNDNTTAEKTFSRGPGQWSFKGSKSKMNNNENKTDQTETKSQTSKAPFQRSWSLRKPSSKSENLPSSVQAAPRPSQSRTNETFLGIKIGSESKNKQRTPMKKYSSQNDLNVQATKTIQSHPTRMTPSASTSSIPSTVSKEYEEVPRSKPPCVGILKTPGKHKISSNNRVEFLNNVREREIPGRHA